MLIYLQRPRCWETYVQSSTLEPSNLQLSKLTRLQIMLSQYVRSVIDWLIKQLDAEISNMQSYLYTDNADKRSTFKSFFSFVFCRHFTNTNGPILFWIPQLHFRLCNQRYISWSAQCSTKPLFYTNCPIWPSEETWHYRSGVNQMVLLKNSNDTSMNIDLLAHELTLVSWWDPCFFFLATIPRSKLTFNEFGYHTD